MNKSELVDAIASASSLTKTDADKAVKGFTEVIIKALSNADDVTIPGFGTWSVTERSARDGRNPQTGETIRIEASKVARFKAGKQLRDAVKES